MEHDLPQPPGVSVAVGPSMGLDLVFVVLGSLAGWQLFRPRQPFRRSVAQVTVAEASTPKRHRNGSPTAQFVQAAQWVAVGKDLEKRKQYEEAIALYSEGLRHYPQDFRLWHEHGLVLAKLERFEMALACYDKAYALQPTQRDLAHERGDTLLQLERYEDAIAAFNIFLRYEPKSNHVLADRGYALYKLHRYEEALRSLTPVLKDKLQNRDNSSEQYAHYYQIACLKELGQLEAALKSSQQALQKYPQESFQEQYEAIRQQIAQTIADTASTH